MEKSKLAKEIRLYHTKYGAMNKRMLLFFFGIKYTLDRAAVGPAAIERFEFYEQK